MSPGTAAWTSSRPSGQWKSLTAAAHYLDQRDETRLRAVAIVEA